jgi:D-alanyl-D-alanine carboxypeptidase/D-alanyl-D-alanine-endopeptidase (penicillin-binding protein 4)
LKRLLLIVFIAHAAFAQTLTETIDKAMATPDLQHAMWAIDVEDDAGNVLYAKNAHTLIMPASNRKIFAAAAAINCLGDGYTYATDLYRDGNNLVIRGNGDPALGGRYAFDRDAVFAPFVKAVRERGMTEVQDIIADVSWFDRVTIPGSWKFGNLGQDYAAPVDALAYNENVVGVRIDDCARPVVTTDPAFVDAVEMVTCGPGEPEAKIDLVSGENVVRVTGTMSKTFKDLPAVVSPGIYAAEALRDALRHAGVPVRGVLKLNVAQTPWRERIATIDSEPLWSLLTVMLKSSQNLYAEMIHKSTAGTYAGAQAREREFLTNDVGIDPAEFRFVDGSGLAPDDLVTPAAIVKMFRWMNARERSGLWWTILATPGEEGTLRRRLVPLATRLRGKTGSIAGVNVLSGIIAGKSGGYRYFSIAINHHTADAVLKVIDEIATSVADF